MPKIVEHWSPRPEVIAERYRIGFIGNGMRAAVEAGMFELRATANETFLPAFKAEVPIEKSEHPGPQGDAGRLARETEISDFAVSGFAAEMEISQPSVNIRGVPYWGFVEYGRGAMGPTEGGALYWEGLGHPIDSVGAADPRPYVNKAEAAGMAAFRPALQVAAQGMLGKMARAWAAGLPKTLS